MTRAIGVVPAAGVGSRLHPYRAPKELIQVGYATVATDGGATRTVPQALIDHTLRAMVRGGVTSALLTLSPAKAEIMRYLGAGAQLGIDLGYVCQEEPRGMPHALDLARPFVGDRTVCMGMPDTIFEPADCFDRLLAEHERRRADLTIGVFPTEDPCALAPVVVDPGTGRVLDIVDKPEHPPASNTWGIAAWSGAFTRLLHEYVTAHGPGARTESLLSEAFLLATKAGLAVYGVEFPDGSYDDLGTPTKLIRARARFERSYYPGAV